jgi:hypothetical protein
MFGFVKSDDGGSDFQAGLMDCGFTSD